MKVEGHADLVRDTNSGAIINRNRNAYEIAKRKNSRSTKNKEMKLEVQREINTLKCEMHEIKRYVKNFIGYRK